MAPRRRRKKKRGFESLIPDVEQTVLNSLRRSAVEIMNDLSKAGPAYSGSFSSAWYAVTPGSAPGGPRSKGGQYKYDLRNVPKSKFKNLRQGSYYEVVNGADYAPQALDLEPGKFFSQEDAQGNLIPPVVTPVETGQRTGPIRGQVSSDNDIPKKLPAISTAPLDWYSTYASGGGLKISFERGVKLGFRDGPGAQRGGFGR